MAGQITFRVSGTEQVQSIVQASIGDVKLKLASAYSVHRHRAGGPAATVTVDTDADVVVLQIADGPLLLLHPENARALLTAVVDTNRDTDSSQDTSVRVTGQLPWTFAEGRQRDGRTAAGAVALEWFGVLDRQKDAERTAQEFAAIIDARVHEGLYPLTAAALSGQLEPERCSRDGQLPASDKPLLIFIHGTFVDTKSTFGKLWQRDAEPVKGLLDAYEGRAFAFEHPTILKSPVANAIALVTDLPRMAELHLATHSRAGLIAEVLLRASQDEGGGTLDTSLEGGNTLKKELDELRRLMREKNITVQRVVRVACPARGTLLASRRLDAYMSVFQWLLGLSGVNATSDFVNLLCAVARCRTSAGDMPGLQAMMPDSALVRWLNAPLKGVDSELYVVAGDAGGDGLMSWLKTLVADAFFWTDNDMVVQTRSMYGGVPRTAGERGPKFRLFTGAQATHFSYFARPDVMESVRAALCGEAGADWKPIGTQSRAGLDASGLRGRPKPGALARAVSGHLPVIVIPDLFGSMLKTEDGHLAWLDEQSLAHFESLDPASHPELHAAGLVPGWYGELCGHLDATHTVIPFPYDWRRDIDDSVRDLEKLVVDLAESTQHADHPIHVIAHGMGGLLVRALQASHPKAWRLLTAPATARIVLLGVPNARCWLPFRLLCGDETFGKLFSATGTLSQDLKVRQILARMPGLLQLQATLADPLSELSTVSGWEDTADTAFRLAGARSWHAQVRDGATQSADGWAVPAAQCLKLAARFWQRLEHALQRLLADADKLITVVGDAPGTVAELETGAASIELVTVDSGDRHVTLDSAMLHGVRTWRMPVPHDALPRTPQYFDALTDLLLTGSTRRLGAIAAARDEAGQPARRQRRPIWHGSRIAAGDDDAGQVTVPAGDEGPTDEGRLTVRVHHGDLRFVKAPLLLGHYRSMSLSGTEAVVDTLVAGRMSKALRAGFYPDRTGSFQIFENGRRHHAGRRKQRMIPRPRAAVIVGLGEEGKLISPHLAYTIRIGVLAMAERLSEEGLRGDRFELAAALIGSGGSGITVSAAALALVQGIADANVRLRGAGWPVVHELTIVEVYLDRATDAWRVLRMQAASTPERLRVAGHLGQGDGALRRPLESSYRGAAYDFISVVEMEGPSDEGPQIAFSLDTRRARTEVRALRAQAALVRVLVKDASNTEQPDGQIGRTLFNLLIPVEIEPYLAGSASMLMELDGTTAALPWELLDTDAGMPAARRVDLEPWAIRCKIIRKLRTQEYREQVVDAGTEDNMLVVGDPLTRYGRLAGARREAAAITDVARAAFGVNADRVTLVAPGADARSVINQLFAKNYRIVHIAGHGTGPDCAKYGGVVLSGPATCLGANEIRAMRVTPELVFLNCCHLAQEGRRDPYNRVAFAAGLAGALIEIGVRCVIAAGWAIEDRASELFATRFYEQLFAGQRFIDAVGAARKAAWEHDPKGNTWAAFQCYGDPEWGWTDAPGSRQSDLKEEYAGIASPMTLILVLQALTSEMRYSAPNDTKRLGERLKHLESTFEPEGWTRRGDVASEFGAAYAALPDRDKALHWLKQAASAADASAPMWAVELLTEQKIVPGATASELQKAIDEFKEYRLAPTRWRYGLLGIAYRRLSVALLAELNGEDAATRHLAQARDDFERAELCQPESLDKHFPMRARLVCEMRAHLLARAQGKAPARGGPTLLDLAPLAQEIDAAVNHDPKFWSIVAQSQFDMLKGVVQSELNAHADDIIESMNDLYRRIPTRHHWTEIADDAHALLDPYLQAQEGNQDEAQAAHRVLEHLDGYAYPERKRKAEQS